MRAGVSLLAIGGRSYGEWARNLALSIRYYEPDIPIQLVYEPSAVRDTTPFDILTEIDRADAYQGGYLNPSYAKLCMDRYYPTDWEHVMFLDVDALCVAPFADLFGPDYQLFCWDVNDAKQGVFPNMLWMRADTVTEHGRTVYGIRDVYELPDQPIPGTNSSFQVMRVGGVCHEIYAAARAAYEWTDERFTPSELLLMKWGRKNPGNETWPDELFFNIALARRGVVDYVPDGRPIYFHTQRTKGGYPGIQKVVQGGARFLGYWGDTTYNHHAHRSAYDRQLRKVAGMGYNSGRLIKEKFVNQRKKVLA